MYDYIIQNRLLILEGITLLFGLIYSYKFWQTPVRMILVYLAIVFGIEYYTLNYFPNDNQWLFSILSLSELLIFTYIFYNSVEGEKFKKIILASCLSCLFFLVIDGLFITKNFEYYLSLGFGFASLGISVMCFIYILEMTKTEKVLNQYRELLYWIVIGLLLYHLCNLPATLLVNSIDEGNIDLILNIQSIVGIGMYLCFIFGFIWSRRLS